MKTIYLMRHGETLFNRMKLNQGQCDSPLTENGIRQARRARDWFSGHGVRFDSVYCSSLERACDTAEIVAPGMPYIRRKGLKEILLGSWEASTTENNPTYPYGDFFVPYGGESLEDFTDRFVAAVREVAEESGGETVLIVSHGMAIRRFLTALDQAPGSILGNCAIVKMTYEKGTFTVEEIIDPNSTDQDY